MSVPVTAQPPSYQGGGQGYPPPQQAGYPPPAQAGYPPPAQAGYPPPAQAGYGGYAQPPAPANVVTVVSTGGATCPNCGGTSFSDHFTCCGIALAIIFFPIGLLCCLVMREKRCSHCGH